MSLRKLYLFWIFNLFTFYASLVISLLTKNINTCFKKEVNMIREWLDKRQFCPNLSDITNEDIKKLTNQLKGESDKETLTNILEWQHRNINYWMERGILELPWRGLGSIYFILVLVVFGIIGIVLYLSLSKILGIAMFTLIGILVFWLLLASLYNLFLIIVFMIVLASPIYKYIDALFASEAPKTVYISIIAMAVFTVLYLGLSYRYLPNVLQSKNFVSKLLLIAIAINDTFKMKLSAEKVLTYKLAICRDYALFTASLLLNLYPEVYFATFLSHVATGIKIKDKIYMLDQKLPIRTLDKWLEVWNKKKVTLYKLEKVYTDTSIELKFSKVGQYPKKKENEPKNKRDEWLKRFESELNELFRAKNTLTTKRCSEVSIPLKNLLKSYENDEIVEYSLLRLLKNTIEDKLCSNVNKINKIKLTTQDDDLNLVVYLR